MKTYSELSKLKTFNERFEYLKLDGSIGIQTFGDERYLNQVLYNSREWRRVRDKVIIRDGGCDLGMEGFDIHGRAIVHHMNPIALDQVLERDPIVFDPEYLITTWHDTHNALHYGNKDMMLLREPVERKRGDTCPWNTTD